MLYFIESLQSFFYQFKLRHQPPKCTPSLPEHLSSSSLRLSPQTLDIPQPDPSSPTLGHIFLFRYHISASNLLSMPLSLPSPTLDLFGGGAIEGSSLPVSAPRVPRFTWF